MKMQALTATLLACAWALSSASWAQTDASSEAEARLRRTAQDLRALELYSYGVDYDQFVELRRRRQENARARAEARQRLADRGRARERIDRRLEEISADLERRRILEHFGVAHHWSDARDAAKLLDEYVRRSQTVAKRRSSIDREIADARRGRDERLEELDHDRWAAITSGSREGLLASIKAAKLATQLTPAGRAGKALKRLGKLTEELDNVAGIADSVHDYRQDGDPLGLAEESTNQGLNQAFQNEPALSDTLLGKLKENLDGGQDVLDLKDNYDGLRDAVESYHEAGREAARVKAEAETRISELVEERGQLEPDQAELDRSLEDFWPDGDAHERELASEEKGLEREARTLEEDDRRDRELLDSLDRDDEATGELQGDWDDLSTEDSGWDHESQDPAASELDALEAEADLLEAVTEGVELMHDPEHADLRDLLDEIDAELGSTWDEEVQQLADDLYEELHGDSLDESDSAEAMDDLRDLLDAAEGELDFDSWMDDFEAELDIDSEAVGSELAGETVDFDRSLLEDQFDSVSNDAVTDTSERDLLAEFEDLVERSDTRGRMRDAASRVRDELDTEMAWLDESLARDLERQRRRAARSPFGSNGMNLTDHLRQLAETYDREVLSIQNGGGLGMIRRPGSIRADTDLVPAPGGFGGLGSLGGSTIGGGGFGSSSSPTAGVFVPWSGRGSSSSGSTGGSGAGAPSFEGISSMSEIYRKSAEFHRLAAEQTSDPAERRKYIEAAREAERMAASLSGR